MREHAGHAVCDHADDSGNDDDYDYGPDVLVVTVGEYFCDVDDAC